MESSSVRDKLALQGKHNIKVKGDWPERSNPPYARKLIHFNHRMEYDSDLGEVKWNCANFFIGRTWDHMCMGAA
jgi:hypothetical protein